MRKPSSANPNYYIPVLCYDLKNNFVKRYESAVAAGKELGLSSSGITACCRLSYNRTGAGGYKWKYENALHDISKINYSDIKREINQFSLSGDYIATYKSQSDAARAFNKDIHNFAHAIHKGKAYGYLWLRSTNANRINNLIEHIHDKEFHILQIDKNGVVVNSFRSALDAEKQTGINNTNICTASTTKSSDGSFYRTAAGFYWVDKNKDPNYRIDFNYKKGHGERAVLQFDLNGNLIREFDSIADAQEFLGLSRNKQSSIYDCVSPNKHTKTAYGYIWKYKGLE